MRKNQKTARHKDVKAQSVLEYMALIGLVVVVLLAMSTGVRRAIQGMVRVVSDHVGIQSNAEQTFDDSGHLNGSSSISRGYQQKERRERLGVFNYIYDDEIYSDVLTFQNMGFRNRL